MLILHSAESLTPIPIGAEASKAQTSVIGLRGLAQQADAIAGSANKMLSDVVGGSLGAIKGLLSSHPDSETAEIQANPSSSWNPVRPGIGLLRRASGFSIASVAASLPGSHKERGLAIRSDEGGQQLKDVSSRPNSIKEECSEEESSEYEDSEEDDEEGEEYAG